MREFFITWALLAFLGALTLGSIVGLTYRWPAVVAYASDNQT